MASLSNALTSARGGREAIKMGLPAGHAPRSGAGPFVRPLSHQARRSIEQALLGEALFRDALLRERKRADRSGHPFAVLLMDRGAAPPDWNAWIAVLREVEKVKGETDLLGWFEDGAVLGLIVPDLADGKMALKAVDRLRRKGAGDDSPALAAMSVRLYAYSGHASPHDADILPVEILTRPIEDGRRHRLRDGAKRALDIAGSLALLALFLPVLLAIYIAVRWTSPGPVFYRQTRIGRRGEAFTMLKFRSMYVNVGHEVHQEYVTWFITQSDRQPRNGDEVFKLTKDPRITPVGNFIRRTSLDELPQFLNVLRGEMSLVGPRPPLPFEVEKYQPWHRRRVLEAKPGVTGLWQVHGRSRTTFDEMVRMDLRYARERSLWADVKILAATPRAMLSGKGAL